MPGEDSQAYAIFAALFSRRLRGPAFRVAGSALRYFFAAQYAAALRPGKIPLARVDHPLDSGIPFRADRIDTYLGFIRLWITAIGWAHREFGGAADGELAAFADEIGACYRDAHGVYRRHVSTTTRYKPAPNMRFRFVYAVDPHLYCVPSLHVMLACESFLGFEAVCLARGIDLATDARRAAALADIRARAVAIIDSVLYVKQHSINCIPAALFMMSSGRTDFGREKVKLLLSELFRGEDLASRRPEILAEVWSLYSRFMDEWEGELPDRHGVLVRFLEGYEARADAPAQDRMAAELRG